MPTAVRTVGSGTSPADIAKVLNEDGCVVIADLAAPETMDQIRAELEPYLAATGGGNTDFLGADHPAHRRPDRPFADRALTDHPPDGHRHARPRVGRPRQHLPGRPDPAGHHRTRRAGADDSSGPVVVRSLPVPEGLRSRSRHHVGRDRLHRRDGRDADGGGQPPVGGRSRRGGPRAVRPSGHDQGFGPAVHRLDIPRRGRQHHHRPAGSG